MTDQEDDSSYTIYGGFFVAVTATVDEEPYDKAHARELLAQEAEEQGLTDIDRQVGMDVDEIVED